MSSDQDHLFLSAEKAEALAAWKSPTSSIVSLYLPVDNSGAYPATLDRLIREAAATQPGLKVLTKDIELISEFVRARFVPRERRGLCVFSSAKHGIFEVYCTPESFSPALKVSDRPYLWPLTLLRSRYYRFVSLQADERGARFTEIHLGEPSPLETLSGDFRGRGVFNLAERAMALFHSRRADRLVFGADPTMLAAFEPLLEPEIADKLIHEPLLGPDRPVEAVVDRLRHNELEALKLREDVLVSRFLDQLQAGLAVAGLERVADALHQDRVARVLVRDGWAKMGRSCPVCHRLSIDHRSCPWCFRPTFPVFDLVSELCDRAVSSGIEVLRVVHDARFESIGPIGAEVKGPLPIRRPGISTSRALRGLFSLKHGGPSLFRD